MTTKQQMYDEIARQATLAEAGGLAKQRAVLLLWFLRNVVGIEELEAYDHVCDGDNDKGIDGLFLELGTGDEEPDTLVIYQSKYTEGPKGKVGATDIDRLSGAANHFTNGTTLDSLLASGLEPSLEQLIRSLGLPRTIERTPPLRTRVVIVTTGRLDGDSQKQVAALRAKHDDRFVEVWDLDRLGPLAASVRSPERLQGMVTASVPKGQLLVTGAPPNRVL